MLFIQSLYDAFDQSDGRKGGDEEFVESTAGQRDAREEWGLDVAGDDEGCADFGGLVAVRRVLVGTEEESWDGM